jgi:hypothetical protein
MRAMSCQERGEKSGTSSLLAEKDGEETSFLGCRLHLSCGSEKIGVLEEMRLLIVNFELRE